MKATLHRSSPNFCYEVIGEDGQELEFVQSDWDYAPLASRFGWSPSQVQRCTRCNRLNTVDEPCDRYRCGHCDRKTPYCDHASDGTVNCNCGVKTSDFLSHAQDFLDEHDGETTDWND
jgi:hypothetical protein